MSDHMTPPVDVEALRKAAEAVLDRDPATLRQVARHLPYWQDIDARKEAGEPLSVLEAYIHDNEPAGDATAWRADVVFVLAEVVAPVLDTLAAVTAENARLRTENADLRASVIAFGGPAMVEWAKARGLPDGRLHPEHYDILARAGARMDAFTRAELPTDSAALARGGEG